MKKKRQVILEKIVKAKNKIGEETKMKILGTIQKNRKTTATNIFRDPELNYNNVSLTIIKQMLIDEGFKARKPLKVHYITETNKTNRVVWCKKTKQWTITR